MNIEDPKGLKPGEDRCPGPSVQDILEQDTRSVPDVLRKQAYSYVGSDDLAVERYFSKEFHDLEVEHVWKKTWQMACREEEIPEIGDHVVYDICGLSLIVTRTAEDEIKAYHNACLHRARKLRTESGSVTQFRCPYHGWTWDVSGELAEIPCRWDFPHITAENGKLPEAEVGTWGGFVFVNMDPDCVSLAEYLGDLPDQFKGWALEDTYTAAHVKKRMPANWKVCAEAFIESYHVIDTHPQIMPHCADANTQYDNFEGEHFNRMITPMAVPSPHLGKVADQETVDAMARTSGRQAPGQSGLECPEDTTARVFMADIAREYQSEATGRDYSETTDSEMLDAIQYFVFPNFFPWGGLSPNIVYRFRPDGNNPESALVEIMLLQRYDKSKPKPQPVPVHEMTDDQVWADAAELGGLGAVFDQDMSNIPYVQEGLHIAAAAKGAVSLGNYQESRVRDLHRNLDRYIYGKNSP